MPEGKSVEQVMDARADAAGSAAGAARDRFLDELQSPSSRIQNSDSGPSYPGQMDRSRGNDQIAQLSEKPDQKFLDNLANGKIDPADQQKLTTFFFEHLQKNGMNGDRAATDINKLLEAKGSDFRIKLEGPYADRHYPVHNMNANNKDFHHVFSLTNKSGNSVPGANNTFKIHWRRG